MVRIAALLYAKDKEAIESADTLLKIFEQQLTHDDSYIYLAAIKGLVALANVRTQEVISRLTKELTSSRVELAPHLQKEAESKIKEKGLYEMKVEKGKRYFIPFSLCITVTNAYKRKKKCSEKD